jgi:DnaJ-class molecular chaperone
VTQTILLGMLAVAGYVVSLYLWPYRSCGRCEGTGRNKGSNRRRFGECRRCRGSGRRRRIGAKTVHRGAVSLAEKARERRQR